MTTSKKNPTTKAQSPTKSATEPTATQQLKQLMESKHKMVKIKWSDANVSVIPDDTIVKAIVDKVEFQAASKSSGQPQFMVTFKVTEPDDYENRKLFRFFSLQSDALWALKQFNIRFGGDPDLFDDDDQDTDDIITALTNLEGYIQVGVNEYPKDSGEFRNNIKKFVTEEVAVA